MSEFNLIKNLLQSSKSQKWDEAKLEWEVIDIEKVEEAETCLCGHFPIIEVCTIKNIKTNREARVGNCCVTKFNNKSNKIFRAVARVKKDFSKSVNSETLELAKSKRWISDWQFRFYMDILRKRNLSPRQLQKKEEVNKIISDKVNKRVKI